jgi:hypothetical protein
MLLKGTNVVGSTHCVDLDVQPKIDLSFSFNMWNVLVHLIRMMMGLLAATAWK